MPNSKGWRMPTPCLDCPFNPTGPGAHLRRSLGPGRMKSIRAGLRGANGEPTYFTCHKTTEETGNGTRLVCAGALAYQEKHNVTSNYQRVCENLEWYLRERERRGLTR